MTEVPEPVRRVVEEWIAAGRPAQPPFPWPRDRWIAAFPAHRELFERLPALLDRAAVAAVGAEAARSRDCAVEAFLAVEAWGFGDRAYGPFRARRILDSNHGAPERLQAMALALAAEGTIAGCRALATSSRLVYLGISFGTKLLYFCQPPDADPPRALILDDFVASWLDREVGFRAGVVEWSCTAYGRYLEHMHEWAAALGIEPDELEMCIFMAEAARRGSTWAGNGAPPPRPSTAAAWGDDGLPFEAYPHRGRVLLGKPPWGDGTARRSYGVKALEWCGYRCAYCGLPMSTFEGWLQLSVDHVIPQQMQGKGYPAEWVLDAFNVVAACGACNGYFNRDPVIGEIPTTLEAFCDLRDRVFRERRARILERRASERSWFDVHIKPQVPG